MEMDAQPFMVILVITPMYTPYELYHSLDQKRTRVLNQFKDVDAHHFHYIAHPGTWSPEMIFRHFLASYHFLSRFLPGEPLPLHTLAVSGSVKNESYQKATVDEVKKALEETAAIIEKRLKDLTPTMEEEVIEVWGEKRPRKDVILMFHAHDHAHLGQIIWLFKRSTGQP